MSETANVALVQSAYDAFGRGDVEAILANVTDDVVWSLEGPLTIPFAGTRRGRQEVRGFFTALGTTQTGQKLEIDEWIAQGDKVATVGYYSFTANATGRSLRARLAHVFTIRDGKIAKFEDFTDTAATLEAYTNKAAAGA